MAGIIDLLASVVFIRAIQLDLEIFPDVHGADSLVSHMFERVLHGLTLWIEHRLFGCNDDLGFHFK